jgi:hypothetical protein
MAERKIAFSTVAGQLVDRLYHLVPTPNSGDDFVWVCGPGEGVLVGLLDEALDGGLKIDHATEDTAL